VYGQQGIGVAVMEHEDSPQEYIISLRRSGISESVCSLQELKFLAEALATAAHRIEHEGF